MQMSHPFPKQRGEFAHVPCRTIFERLIPITGPRIVGSVRTTDGLGAGAPCRVLPLFTEPGPRIHAGAEIAIDKFQADDSPDHRYRTTPFAGLFARDKGGFYHHGRFPMSKQKQEVI
jgi:hypothetical protein